ncbi:hypothetical protein ACOBQX_26790 [Actinokineospora sp. G85]|uniref:hypothetical protein n=1 Tax=Actinokineospora sp. G85 TaxID=3406626 RepID=UPI003C739A06
MTDPHPSIADSLDVSAYDEGFGANLDRAVEHVPGVGTVYKGGKSIVETAQELGQAEDFGDLAAGARQLATDGGAFVASAAVDVTTFAMDPIGWLVSNGLNMLLELVQPLQDALHQVSGDGPAIGHASDNFTTIAQGFVALAEDFRATGDTSLQDWQGEAADAARAALADFSVGIEGVGSSAGSVAETLQMWSIVMVVIEEVIKAIISELVSWLITLWLPALAASVISFGGSVAAAMTASIAKAGAVLAKVTKHLGKFGKLLDQFMAFLVKVSGKLEAVAKHFRIGKVVDSGGRQVLQPSRRVLTTMFGTHAGITPFLTGAGIKAGIGAATGVDGQVRPELTEQLGGGPPALNESGIGGDRTAEETRRNLDF